MFQYYVCFISICNLWVSFSIKNRFANTFLPLSTVKPNRKIFSDILGENTTHLVVKYNSFGVTGDLPYEHIRHSVKVKKMHCKETFGRNILQ
ncbi:hypothetical protein Avbf_09389 [Armadillidium vulgare]|nr:hypothetical protein Avbf_09389 [Armadillidium vulgare]